MKSQHQSRSGFTLVEILVTTALIGVLGLIIFSVLNTGTLLGAKNTAVNTAHQQARTAMLQMTQTIRSAVSLPQLIDSAGNPTAGPAEGVSFQVWAGGPYRIAADTTDAWTSVQVNVTDTPFTNGDPPLNQRLIIPGYELEANIKKPAGTTGSTTLIPLATPAPTPPAIQISGTGAPTNSNIACFITSRCYYLVNNGALEWHYTDQTTGLPAVVTLMTGINDKPFTLASGDVAVTLSSEDANYSNQDTRADEFKSTKVLLSETIRVRTKLTSIP